MCFFAGFRADFVTSVRVSVASAGVFALASARWGPKTPRRCTPSAPPPPLGYVSGSLALPARIARIASNQIAVNSHNTCLLHATLSRIRTVIQLNNDADMTNIHHSSLVLL